MKVKLVKISVILAAIIFIISTGCDKEEKTSTNDYFSNPQFFESKQIISGVDTLKPVRLQLVNDSLYISYNNRSVIDIFNLEFIKIGTIHLSTPEDVFPTSFFVADSNIFVADHSKGSIVIYNRNGRYLNSFGVHPDGTTRLSPFALTYYGGVLYASDIKQKSILAISMVNAEGITEQGELIQSIPDDTLVPINFGSSIMITFDGRLMAGDAVTGRVNVYTCDGRFIYYFDSVSTSTKVAPQAFDIDNFLDPELKAKDSSSFDPSGIRNMGRIHLVDANNGAVHMFNPLGKYIGTYPDNKSLGKPSGICINRKTRTIYIADPSNAQILLYKY